MVRRKRARAGFSRVRRINDNNAIYSAEQNSPDLHFVAGVHPIVYVLITNRYATLHELKTRYTIWDVLDMYEIAMVNLYNRYVLTETKK